MSLEARMAAAVATLSKKMTGENILGSASTAAVGATEGGAKNVFQPGQTMDDPALDLVPEQKKIKKDEKVNTAVALKSYYKA